MGGGGAHRGDIPHYTKYQIADYPLYAKYQQQLANEGLKDPWIRNNLWRHTAPVTKNGGLPYYHNFLKAGGIFLGIRLGVATVATYIIADQLVLKNYRSKDDHHGH